MKFLLPLVVILALAAASVVSVRHAVADSILDDVVAGFRAAWAESVASGEPIKGYFLTANIERLKFASGLAPARAAFFEVMGSHYLTPALQNGVVSTNPLAAHAVQRETVSRLPTFPYVWADLLSSADLIATSDPSTRPNVVFALQQATKLGPWEREVSMVVVDVGLANWEQCDAATKSLVRQAVSRLAFRYPEDVMTLAAKRGNVSVVCGDQQLRGRKECESSTPLAIALPRIEFVREG